MEITSHLNHSEFTLYNSIINGSLRPHLPDNNDAVRLTNLYRQEVWKELFDSPEGIPHVKLALANPHFLRFKELLLKDGDEIEFEVHDDGKVMLSFPHNTDNLIDLDIPEPTNVVSAYYLFEIEKEYHRLQVRFLQLSTDPSLSSSDLDNYCNRNLQLLKVLAARAHTYSKQLEDAGYTDQLKHTPSYALWVLKEYIVRTILLLQEIFEPYLRVRPLSWKQLEVKYYEYAQRMAKVEKNWESRKKRDTPKAEKREEPAPTSWEELFKNSKAAEKIKEKLREEGYITSDGAWQASPILPMMIALYLVLVDRGYLKQPHHSSTLISNLFNQEFGTNFTSRSWQPNKRSNAEELMDKFNLIPKYRPEDYSS